MAEALRLTGLLRQLGRRMRHLSDEDLLALIESATSDAHLDGCDRCATRHAELLCVIAELDVVHAEADAAFDEERLLHQRTHILRRLDRNNGPARVLPFPAAAEGARGMHVLSVAGRRWVAAAAIGGVLVGIFSGRLITHRSAANPVEAMRQARTATVNPAIVPADLRGARRDEILLEEVDTALSHLRVDELSAIDAITPAAR
jgi:hypothetical protein